MMPQQQVELLLHHVGIRRVPVGVEVGVFVGRCNAIELQPFSVKADEHFEHARVVHELVVIR
jgi:hypothetical protein